MPSVNDTKFQTAVFILTGIRGLEDVHVWISIPFCLMYIISILGNSVILFIIKTDRSLHEPMYIFLSMLAFTDLVLSLSTMPTTLGIYWFQSREISHDACFAQLFFIHAITLTQSAVLLCMAFDRFVAICNPLRYTSILTLPRIAKLGLVCLLKGVVLILPLPTLLKQHQYCKDKILSQSYCLHQDVMTKACSDISVNIIYGFFLTVSSRGLDLLLILVSYVMILKTVLSIASHAERLKALNTCVSHVCVVLLFYIPHIALAVIYRFVKNPSPIIQIVVGNVYMLVPPVMNPIVYSVKIQAIRVRIIRVFVK
ncbi:olfactory receptor 51G2-like [Emydura macquarii macquarii]|uniref:olfactory receptor 51G2-like n=1 Tax=Emydura macquarii macquarii TaxID=1129001 RepID=UPI00352A47F7